jgi:hypothetical protein
MRTLFVCSDALGGGKPGAIFAASRKLRKTAHNSFEFHQRSGKVRGHRVRRMKWILTRAPARIHLFD